MRSTVWLALTGSLLVAAPLAAQEREQSRGAKGEKSEIPEGHKPPAGLCRIWLNGVPAGQQPAPTDCASAVRNRPGNGRVIFGEKSEKSSLPGPRFAPGSTREPSRTRGSEEPEVRPRGGEEPRGKAPKKSKPDPEADPLA